MFDRKTSISNLCFDFKKKLRKPGFFEKKGLQWGKFCTIIIPVEQITIKFQLKFMKVGDDTVLEQLIGKQRHTIDDKNRTFIPAKFRTKLGDSIYVTKSFNYKCLCLYSKEGFDIYMKDLVNKLPKVKGAAVISWLGANSEEIQVDGQGRIALPLEYRQFAGLDKNVVSSGAFDHVELWDEQTFDEHDTSIDLAYVKSLLESVEDQEA